MEGLDMEMYVLIPWNLSLVITSHPQPTYSLELGVTIWSKAHISAGSIIYPTFRCMLHRERMLVKELLGKYDIRRRFGGYDAIHNEDGEARRHCNWVSVVRSSSNLLEANVFGAKNEGYPFFVVLHHINPNDEIIAYFADDEMTSSDGVTSPVTSLDLSISSERTESTLRDKYSEERELSRGSPTNDDHETADTEGALVQDSEGKGVDDEDEVSSSFVLSKDQEVKEEWGKRGRKEKKEELATGSEGDEDAGNPSVSKEERTGNKDGGYVRSPKASKQMKEPSPSPAESNRSSPREERSTLSEMPDTKPCLQSTPKTIFPIAFSRAPQTGGTRQVRKGRQRKNWPCHVCVKSFDRPSLLKRHLRTHTGEKPHVCDVCDKPFSTSSSLNTHRRIHSGEKPHQCLVCGKRFTASSNLYYHRMTHNKEKPHKCNLCPKSFPTPGDLRSHKYVHSGSWPFKCSVCNKGFSKQNNLKNHMLLHTGDKPHECPKCKKRFALPCNLKTHIKIHEAAENPKEACSHCGVEMRDKDQRTADGTCLKCYTLSPMGLDMTSQQKTAAATGSRNRSSDFSISKLTEGSTASANHGSHSGVFSRHNSPITLPPHFGQYYSQSWPLIPGPPFLPVTSSAPTPLVPTSQFGSPVVTTMMEDMTSHPVLYFGPAKATVPASSFISPDVLARGGGIIPPAAHTPSPYCPFTSTSPSSGGGGWKKSVAQR